MRDWTGNIPAMIGQSDYQNSHHDIIDAARSGDVNVKPSPISLDFMVWLVGQPIYKCNSDDTAEPEPFRIKGKTFDEVAGNPPKTIQDAIDDNLMSAQDAKASHALKKASCPFCGADPVDTGPFPKSPVPFEFSAGPFWKGQ